MPKIKRTFTLALDPALAEAIGNWMDEWDFPHASEAVRALCRVGLDAVSPIDGLQKAMIVRAYNEARKFSNDRIANAHQEIAQHLRDSFDLVLVASNEKENG